MKTLLNAFLMTALVFNIAAARKKNKAGKIEEGVYYDKKHNFSLVIPDEWNSSIKKDKSKLRLTLIKKQYDIPTHFQHAPDYTKIPKVIVYVDNITMPLNWFVDSLLSDKYKSKQKKEMLPKLEILYGEFIQYKRAKISIGDIKGIKISGERLYRLEVQKAGTQADKADVVSDFYGGSIFLTKVEDTLIIFHFICEKRYFTVLEQSFIKLLKGFKVLDK